MKVLLAYFLFLVVVMGCSPTDPPIATEDPICPNAIRLQTKITTENNSTYLYGGDSSSMNFEVSNWNFDKCSLMGGLGREKFPALDSPDYREPTEVSILKSDSCLVLFKDSLTLVYPYAVMSFHEAVNERVNNEAVLVAYCKLANLAVVYDRKICDIELDFAISGYTYAQPSVYNGIRSFIMWDRQTESLWWPLSDLGVSGFFKNRRLEKYDESLWKNMIWEDVEGKYDNIKVLYNQLPDEELKSLKVDEDEIDC